MATFVKHASADALAYEAAGLRWLAEADPDAVVGVVSVDENSLVTERLESVATSDGAAAEFAERLVRVHDAGADSFGCPPADWSGDGYVGAARLTLRGEPRWGRMYADQRMLPYAHQAHRQGLLDNDQLRTVERLADRLRDGDFDDDAPPARIHGDLWAGNVITTEHGMVMIDPAAQGGHRLNDLALLALFGFPQLRTVHDGYARHSHHLPDDWRDLIDLHQVHHLLVHVVLFGSSYVPPTMAAIGRYV
ncbi:fructosamine kinase family protein [Naumannella halotolerans]|uniref:Fructosamine-3-kinase n=1 Tax=Naumannella halotolerans TaxID=993414 RepID=A0A4R7JA99_9ACTN|nr:fructosamine kinase family protein [Naumannella halotolerans]TDT34492.1 fructosamine-3-kinase [Naumannella halotolerans]